MEIDTDDMSDHETILPPAQYQVPPPVANAFAPAATTAIQSADDDVENDDEDTVVSLSQSDMRIAELEGKIRKLQNNLAISQKEKERMVAEQTLSDLDKDKAGEEVDRLEKEVSDLRDEASEQKTRITGLVGELNRRRYLDDMKLFNRRITRVEARGSVGTHSFPPLSKDTEEDLLGLGTDTTNGRLSLLASNANLFEELFAELADLVRYVREVSMAKCEEGRLADRELQIAGRQVVKWTDWLEELIADAREVYENITG
jgi:predicted RNase H-like nuclease (RuvC/YqgF family)